MHRGIVNPIQIERIATSTFSQNRLMLFYVVGADRRPHNKSFFGIHCSKIHSSKKSFSVASFPTYPTRSFIIYKKSGR